MAPLRCVLTLALASTAGAARADDSASDHFRLQDLLPRSFQKDPRIGLTVITEYTPEGRKVAPATPEKPVYYLGVDGGMGEVGDVKGGERPPTAELLKSTMAQALAVNGYRPADAAHPKSLFIVFRWGAFNQIATSMDPTGAMDDLQTKNLVERADIVGGSAFGMKVAKALRDGQLPRLEDAEPILMQQTMADLYFVLAMAFDAKAVEQGHKILLWWTKMSTASTGLTMDETVPVLVRAAEPYFGREMSEAKALELRMNAGQVTVGALQFKGFVAPPNAPAR